MMFYSVIPPPPSRYTTPLAYAAGTVNGMPVPVTETVNVIKHPEGGCDLEVREAAQLLSGTHRAHEASAERGFAHTKWRGMAWHARRLRRGTRQETSVSRTSQYLYRIASMSCIFTPFSSSTSPLDALTVALRSLLTERNPPKVPLPTSASTASIALAAAVADGKLDSYDLSWDGPVRTYVPFRSRHHSAGVNILLAALRIHRESAPPANELFDGNVVPVELLRVLERDGGDGDLPTLRQLLTLSSLGLGTYVLRDDLVLATPPLHPSEPAITNPNPLSTTPQPPTCGVKVTPVYFENPNPTTRYFPVRAAGNIYWPNAPTTRNGRSLGSAELTPVYGEALASSLASGSGKDKNKDKDRDPNGLHRRKPKSNIVKSGSSFISRVLNYESAPRRLTDRPLDGMFLFANINRAFEWLDLAGKHKQDPYVKILFTKAHMLCHSVNEWTKSQQHLDAVLGSSLGDILWYELMSQKYTRINKNGIINKTAVNHIEWIPGSENLFLAATCDGCLIVYDKEREDVPFVSEEVDLDGAPPGSGLAGFESLSISPGTSNNNNGTRGVGFAAGTAGGQGQAGSSRLMRNKFRILKSVNSPNQSKNPVALYKLSHLAVNRFAFSPDGRHLAVVLEDGTLRVIDFLAEKQLDVFNAYYGGIICCAWSPDGKYIITGGQDDLVTIWSFVERRIVARCHGHGSWVQCVAFDPWRCECEKGEYRFGSVGDDCRLLLWDFSPAMVHRPKEIWPQHRNRNSIITATTSLHPATLSQSLTNQDREREMAGRKEREPLYHPVEKRNTTAQLPPIMSKKVGEDPITWLFFFDKGIMCSSLEATSPAVIPRPFSTLAASGLALTTWCYPLSAGRAGTLYVRTFVKKHISPLTFALVPVPSVQSRAMTRVARTQDGRSVSLLPAPGWKRRDIAMAHRRMGIAMLLQ
ncbi:hypothetical protein KEM55_009178 [Ascosphaera atra]|nr:hypothetical protein KEM55_009178 [Ascosphaera atra]